MNLIEKRKDNANLIAKGRFIKTVLDDQAREIKEAQTQYMTGKGFSQDKFFSKRRFETNEDQLTATFLKLHRFVDMKTRTTKDGVIRKKNHPIYNRIIFGHIPNIVRTLSFGFSDAIIEEMKKLEKTP